jgi:hypothetical protein
VSRRPPIEWSLATAIMHAEADQDCGREWSCACGACRTARPIHLTYAGLLKFAAGKIGSYQQAIRGSWL